MLTAVAMGLDCICERSLSDEMRLAPAEIFYEIFRLYSDPGVGERRPIRRFRDIFGQKINTAVLSQQCFLTEFCVFHLFHRTSSKQNRINLNFYYFEN